MRARCPVPRDVGKLYETLNKARGSQYVLLRCRVTASLLVSPVEPGMSLRSLTRPPAPSPQVGLQYGPAFRLLTDVHSVTE